MTSLGKKSFWFQIYSLKKIMKHILTHWFSDNGNHNYLNEVNSLNTFVILQPHNLGKKYTLGSGDCIISTVSSDTDATLELPAPHSSPQSGLGMKNAIFPSYRSVKC